MYVKLAGLRRSRDDILNQMDTYHEQQLELLDAGAATMQAIVTAEEASDFMTVTRLKILEGGASTEPRLVVEQACVCSRCSRGCKIVPVQGPERRARCMFALLRARRRAVRPAGGAHGGEGHVYGD